MPGINQLPAGSEFAAAISVIWAVASWICSWLLLWLTWSHHEKWSYLAFLSISCIFSNTFSIVQQGRDITWYTENVTQQFVRKQNLPADDPELAIAGGSYGVDLALYYLQYYSYNVQAMLVMFWAAELCQLTYQVRENRKIRHIMRKVHSVGITVAWTLPMITILCLRIPSLKKDFVAFLLIADLPCKLTSFQAGQEYSILALLQQPYSDRCYCRVVMLSLAISSSLMLATTLKYLRSRHKFTHWTPPKFNSANSSQVGTSFSQVGSASQTGITSQTGAKSTRSPGSKGLYDRWLLVRFTIAFVLLAIFEVTNTLFQITALHSNMQDAQASAPDLTAGRAIQTFFLFIPGTTPGIFIYIVFGTTAASRQKVADLFSRQDGALARGWQSLCSYLSCCGQGRRRNNSNDREATGGARTPGGTGITVERSLTITSTSRIHGASHPYGNEDDLVSSVSSNQSDISLDEVPKLPGQQRVKVAPWRQESHMVLDSAQLPSPKPLPKSKFIAMGGAQQPARTTRFDTSSPISTTSSTPTTPTPTGTTNVGVRGISSVPIIDEKRRAALENDDSGAIVRLSAVVDEDTLQVPGQQQRPDGYHRMGPEHSDDSGPTLPIQKPEVRFDTGADTIIADSAATGGGYRRGEKHARSHGRNYSRPGR
ncbi:hypothetical protein BD289DRAFT_237725 [Coniella lustricola]|uniref:Uncharacterized protein n=1 Tax=Coniella lustricola TaxID=2025994 RepID=A0A2T3ALA8_9PEZI|nr:hypothetical protein BD289DRAFT_237725 [Coniella lustricola]